LPVALDSFSFFLYSVKNHITFCLPCILSPFPNLLREWHLARLTWPFFGCWSFFSGLSQLECPTSEKLECLSSPRYIFAVRGRPSLLLGRCFWGLQHPYADDSPECFPGTLFRLPTRFGRPAAVRPPVIMENFQLRPGFLCQPLVDGGP